MAEQQQQQRGQAWRQGARGFLETLVQGLPPVTRAVLLSVQLTPPGGRLAGELYKSMNYAVPAGGAHLLAAFTAACARRLSKAVLDRAAGLGAPLPATPAAALTYITAQLAGLLRLQAAAWKAQAQARAALKLAQTSWAGLCLDEAARLAFLRAAAAELGLSPAAVRSREDRLLAPVPRPASYAAAREALSRAGGARAALAPLCPAQIDQDFAEEAGEWWGFFPAARARLKDAQAGESGPGKLAAVSCQLDPAGDCPPSLEQALKPAGPVRAARGAKLEDRFAEAEAPAVLPASEAELEAVLTQRVSESRAQRAAALADQVGFLRALAVTTQAWAAVFAPEAALWAFILEAAHRFGADFAAAAAALLGSSYAEATATNSGKVPVKAKAKLKTEAKAEVPRFPLRSRGETAEALPGMSAEQRAEGVILEARHGPAAASARRAHGAVFRAGLYLRADKDSRGVRGKGGKDLYKARWELAAAGVDYSERSQAAIARFERGSGVRGEVSGLLALTQSAVRCRKAEAEALRPRPEYFDRRAYQQELKPVIQAALQAALAALAEAREDRAKLVELWETHRVRLDRTKARQRAGAAQSKNAQKRREEKQSRELDVSRGQRRETYLRAVFQAQGSAGSSVPTETAYEAFQKGRTRTDAEKAARARRDRKRQAAHSEARARASEQRAEARKAAGLPPAERWMPARLGWPVGPA